MTYLSMIVMRGETKPEAQAAAVTSEVTLHETALVFHWRSLHGRVFDGITPGFVEICGRGLSPSESWRPLRSTLRVMTFSHATSQR